MSKKSSTPNDQRIRVFARCRPMNSMEIRQGSISMMEFIPEMNKLVLKTRKTSKEYLFDQVFSPDSEQIAVYEAVVEPLVNEVLEGYSCTVFAYGQTGTGKTYTMEGGRNGAKCPWRDDPAVGIIPRSLHQLFEELDQAKNVEFSVKVSFFEIYNEEVYDLLSSSDFTKLRVYEDSRLKDSVQIRGLEEVLIKTKDEAHSILKKGAAKRHTAETKLNASSSRSHTVFSVTVDIIETTSNGAKVKKTGKFNLVDLAGSENVRRSGAINKRAREAGNINQSLLTLGRVITALIEKQAHVPYRESKLTRILQYSLGGHAKTSIIATISPAQSNLDETIRTLDYAARTKTIEISPESNRKLPLAGIIEELTKENEHLRIKNEELVRDLAAARSNVDVENQKSMIQKISLMEEELKALKAENSKLREEAELATNDGDTFHAKVRAPQTAATTNDSACKSLHKLCQKQCAYLYDMVAGYSQETKKFSNYFKANQDHFDYILKEQKQKASDLHEYVKNSLASKCDGEFLSSLLDDLYAHKAAIEACFEKLNNVLAQTMCFMFQDMTGNKQGVINFPFIITGYLKELRKFQLNSYEILISNLASRNSEELGNIKSNNHVTGINTTSSNRIDTEFKYLDENLATLLDISALSGDVFEESKKASSISTSQLQKALLENVMEVENFISGAFVTGITTGTSPPQRLFYSPRNPKSTVLCPQENVESDCPDTSSLPSSQNISSAIMPETHSCNKDRGSNKENREVSRLPRRKSVRFSEPPTVSGSKLLSPSNYKKFCR